MHGAHLFGVDGEGYMLAWEEGAQDFARTDWRHGIVYRRARACASTSISTPAAGRRAISTCNRQPATADLPHRRAAYGDTSVYAAGSATIPFAEQDPRIHTMWLEAIAGKGRHAAGTCSAT